MNSFASLRTYFNACACISKAHNPKPKKSKVQNPPESERESRNVREPSLGTVDAFAVVITRSYTVGLGYD